MNKLLILSAIVAVANAFAPSPFGARASTRVYQQYGKYDGKLWDNEAKKAVYNEWNPAAPRSPMNFNPFETFGGNSPDASGHFPGEAWYKDPTRGDINFAQMMIERKEAEDRAASPKPGSGPGCAGCRN